MGKNWVRLAFAYAMLLSGTNLLQAQVTIDGELRPRTEFRQGVRRPLADTLKPSFLTLQRTRLNFDYKSKTLNAKIRLQDARLFGKSDNKSNDSKMEIFEGWAEYFFIPELSLQVGRQVLQYSDTRILSGSNWANTDLSHDVTRLKFAKNDFTVHLGYAYNNSKDTTFETNYTVSKFYKTMGLLFVSKKFSNGLNLSLLGLLEGLQKKNDYTIVYPRATYGGNVLYQNDSSFWGFTVSGYLQQGKSIKDYKKLNAYFLTARVNVYPTKDLSAYIAADYYSGTDTVSEKIKSNTFERLYGGTHTVNGAMEYWVTLPLQGLMDINFGGVYKINKMISADLSWHFLRLANDLVIKNETYNRNMGSDLDLVFNFTFSKEVSAQIGYSTYFNSGSTKPYFKMAGIETKSSQWTYVSFSFKPQFFTTASK